MITRLSLLAAIAIGTVAASPPMDWNRVVVRTATASHVVGNPGAKVKLTTWVSYTCPSCARFETESEAALKLQFIRSGKLSLETRHLIRDPIDLTVAMLTHCGPKEKFVMNHAAFMRGQARWIGPLGSATKAQQARWTTGSLAARARAIAGDFGFYAIMASRGYDRQATDKCLTDVALAQRLAQGTEAAGKLGIDHTPSFAIDGLVLAGTNGWSLLEPQLQARM